MLLPVFFLHFFDTKSPPTQVSMKKHQFSSFSSKAVASTRQLRCDDGDDDDDDGDNNDDEDGINMIYHPRIDVQDRSK